VAVWDSLENTPGYAAVTGMLQRLFGADFANALLTPYVLGDRRALRALLADAGVGDADVTTHEGTARFPSIDAWIFTDVKGWTLADMIDDAQYERLREEAQRVLQDFVGRDGTVAFRAPAHIATARKPA
jgi:hypothetical protein